MQLLFHLLLLVDAKVDRPLHRNENLIIRWFAARRTEQKGRDSAETVNGSVMYMYAAHKCTIGLMYLIEVAMEACGGVGGGGGVVVTNTIHLQNTIWEVEFPCSHTHFHQSAVSIHKVFTGVHIWLTGAAVNSFLAHGPTMVSVTVFSPPCLWSVIQILEFNLHLKSGICCCVNTL